jgi:hypothetical protein
LLVYIDDAAGKLLHLCFCEAETTFDYMLSTRAYIEQYGKPLTFYSDKHLVFRVKQKSKQDSQAFASAIELMPSRRISLIKRF